MSVERRPEATHRSAPRAVTPVALALDAVRGLVQLAALVCEAPQASLTLRGEGMSWRRGAATQAAPVSVKATELDRLVESGTGILEVADAARDERCRALVDPASGERAAFFAGIALCTADGHALGTLTVQDGVPRSLTAAQRAALTAVAREVSERVALCEELALARAMIESAPVAIYRADAAGDVTAANPEYRRLLQLAPTDSLRDWAKAIHADDRKRVSIAWEAFCRDSETGTAFDYRTLQRDGTVRILTEQVNAAAGGAGYVGSITDITDRVAAGERLQQFERLHRSTVDQSPMGIAYLDREGSILRCNPSYAAMLGYEASELVGMSLHSLNDPADADRDAGELASLWQGKADSYSLEKRYRRKDGRALWVRASAGLIRDADGVPQCSVCFDRDISERKAIEVALAESRQVLEATISDVPVAILACDLRGRLLVHNRAAAELFALPNPGSTAVTALGAYALGVDVFLPDGVTPLARDQRPLARALRGETVTNMEMVVKGAEGEERATVSSARQIYGSYGETLGAVVVSQDVTERKRGELDLERVHKQLLDASRMAGMAEVATNVLHNVGNVLNSVNVSVSRVGEILRQPKAAGLAKVVGLLAAHQGDLGAFITADERGRRLPGYLAKLAERLAADERLALDELAALRDHIDHIKETVVMQQSYAKLCGISESVAAATLVEDCLRMNTGALTRHGVTVRREIADLPPITVDKHKVLQILVNLVRNAKYACDEAPRADREVVVRVEDAGPMVRISVIDNGIGIAPEDMARLFSHGFTTRKSGHGFGLHSAALAARELGGTLTAQSDGRGCGATFTLEIPREASRG